MPTAPDATPISRRELGRATLARQLLLVRAPVDAVEAVSRLAGMQAQEPRPPFVGLWSRVAGFRAEQLLGALAAGTAVRGPLFRATLHLVSAADWSTFRPPAQPALDRALRALGNRADGIDLQAVGARARELLAETPRTSAQLRTLLHGTFPDHEDRALGYAVRTTVALTMVATDDAYGFPRDPQLALAEPTRPLGTVEDLVAR
jgi:hypothetical protein